MRKLFVFLFMLSLAFMGNAQQNKARIDSLMEYYAQTFDYNGAAFVSVKGKTLLKRGYGYQDYYKNIKNDPDNIFMMGSITKQFTAEIILMLAKENKLNLQDKLTKYFPGYPSGDKITIEHLLTHSSGIYNYTEDTLWRNHPTMAVTEEQMLTVFKDKPLGFEPGAKFEYCNSGYMLLSYIIEKITGKPYADVATARILVPLKMAHSGFDYARLKDKRKTVGYNSVMIDSFYISKVEDMTQSLGAGALYSTVEDLYKWHRALQSNTLLDKEWQQKAFTLHNSRYGYGWFVVNDFLGKKILGHSGGISGFYTYLMYLPQEDLCIALLTNVRHGGVDLNEVSLNILKCLYDTTFRIPAIRKEIKLPLATLKNYEGEYVLAADTSISVTFKQKDQHLYMTVTDQPEDRIYAQTENMFFAKNADAQFEFVKDEKDRYKLFLYQHGQKFEALLRQ
jgi:CubicO group peptidase (beta-lactamase class C family)